MSIRISERHGVNPTLGICFYCGDDSGEIGLLGRLPGDAEAPRKAVLSLEPCEKCKGYMAQGVILISVKDDSKDRQNPHRTGGWCVVTEDAIRRMITDGPIQESILKKRVAFIPDQAWDVLGLPRS